MKVVIVIGIGIIGLAVVITLVVFGIRRLRQKRRKYKQPKPLQTEPSEKDKGGISDFRGPDDYTSSYNQRCSAKPKAAFDGVFV